MSDYLCRFLSTSVLHFTILFSFQMPLSDTRQTRHLYAQSIQDLQELEQFEFKIAKNLTQILLTSDVLLIGSEIREKVHAYLVDFYGTSGFSGIKDTIGGETTRASANPICAYRLIRRVKFLLQDLIFQKLGSIKLGSLKKEIVHFFWKNGWPTHGDLLVAAEKLLRIPHVYDLDINMFSTGWIANRQTNCTLNSIHCYEIGKIALKNEQFTSAIEWLETAKRNVLTDHKSSLPMIQFLLRNAIEKHNINFDEENKLDLEPFYFNRKIRHIPEDGLKAQKMRNIQYETFHGRKEKQFQSVNYWGLCSGKTLQTDQEKSHLFCWYEYRIHRIFTIGPMKMEFLARNPDIVQIHAFLHEKEIQRIRAASKPGMPNFVLENSDTKKAKRRRTLKPKDRSSVRTWWSATANTGLSRRIEQITGLRSEENAAYLILEVESYSFGGHHAPHFDETLSKPNHFLDNRFALLQFYVMGAHVYLSDVEQGGDTVFTSSGVAIKPIKGSAVFWFNMKSDGGNDPETTRGECPVLFGQKWVANKWIKLGHQTLQLKCGLKPNKRYQIPVNSLYIPMQSAITEEINVIPSERSTPAKVTKYSYVVPRGLEALAQLELTIYARVKELYNRYRNKTTGTFREEFDRENKDVKMYLLDFEKSSKRLLGFPFEDIPEEEITAEQKIAWNPLAAYRMVARFVDFIQVWVQTAGSTNNKLKKKIGSFIRTVYDTSDGPFPGDLEAALFPIVHLQNIYNLTLKDIAEGYVNGVNTHIVLNARDCFRLGKHSVTIEFFRTGIEWFEHSLYLLQVGSDDSIKIEDVSDALATAELTNESNIRKMQITGQKNSETDAYLDSKFWRMCQGEDFQAVAEKSKLFCWYEHEIHPMYKIGPVKVELHSTFPHMELVQFYDIFTDKTFPTLTNLSYQNFMSRKNVSDFRRTQTLYAFGDVVDEEASMRVTKLIERLTGLVVDHPTNVVRTTASAPGGHTRRHTDSGRPGNTHFETGTFLLYFNDVKKGGQTAFVEANALVTPKKGSAIWCYNVFSDGTFDYSTTHGGCPVIFGEKWGSWNTFKRVKAVKQPQVGVRWMRYNTQYNQQCHTKPRTRFENLVNGKSKYRARRC